MMMMRILTQTLIYKYCHVCAYPPSICDVDISVIFNKVIHYLHMASFHCHVQGSSLIKRSEVSNAIFRTSQNNYRLGRHVLIKNSSDKGALLCVIHSHTYHYITVDITFFVSTDIPFQMNRVCIHCSSLYYMNLSLLTSPCRGQSVPFSCGLGTRLHKATPIKCLVSVQ